MIIQVKKAQTTIEKMKGLLGEKEPYPLFLQTRWGIHTFGMKFPIDVVVLDDTYTVKNCKQNMLPNGIFLWNPRYRTVLELPLGTIERLKIKGGCKLSLKVI